MELKKIKFETAVLAKELGFNVPCIDYWYKLKSNSTPYTDTGVEYRSELLIEWDWNNNSGNGTASPYPNREYKYQYSAPTQDLLSNWILELHNIHCTVTPARLAPNFNYGKNPKWFPYTLSLDDGTCKNKTFSNPYDDISEAYEESLMFGLTLIKNKNL